jgi:murein DD-endopeptidase MepM/ murein hydrolase activator NlpD
MILKVRNGVILVGLLLFGWLGWGVYKYFFDLRKPEILLSGLDQDHYYCGDVACALASNKSGEVTVSLDGKQLIQRFKISQEQPFTIPSKTVSNGKHQLKVDFIDGTYRKNKASLVRDFFVDNMPLQAALVKSETDYKVFQGRTLHVQFQVNKPIEQASIAALSGKYACFPESKESLVYETFIPINCEENPNEYLFALDILDKVGNGLHLENKFQVVQYPFKKQTLQVSDEKIKEEYERATGDNMEDTLEKLVQQSPHEKLWRGAFCVPSEVQRITCEFGTIRTTQQKGRYVHRGIDIINLPKSIVWAPQSGIVALKDRFGMTGNTVVIDHGWGIFSLFFHLDDFAKNLQVGTKIAKGSPLGTIGKTGYATGYHLHWEMRVNNIGVDPLQWTKESF